MKTIGIAGEFTPTFEPHCATNRAIEHSRDFLDLEIDSEWVSTDEIDETFFDRFDGLWVAPGSPYKSMERVLRVIRHSRENRIPTMGTCGGFQHILLEYARNVIGIEDAQHAEYDPYASKLFISELACSLAGSTMDLTLEKGSRVAEIYGSRSARESYYCNFSVNPEYREEIENGPVRISGTDADGEIRVVEFPGHPFFFGTLFVPQTRSTPEKPHPLVTAFLKAVVEREV